MFKTHVLKLIFQIQYIHPNNFLTFYNYLKWRRHTDYIYESKFMISCFISIIWFCFKDSFFCSDNWVSLMFTLLLFYWVHDPDFHYTYFYESSKCDVIKMWRHCKTAKNESTEMDIEASRCWVEFECAWYLSLGKLFDWNIN